MNRMLMYKKLLHDVGWAEIDCVPNKKALQEIAQDLGIMIPGPSGEYVSVLCPVLNHESRSKSFSYHYGLGKFPLHTDTAFWKVPARYLVMMSDRPSSTDTNVLSSRGVQEVLGSKLARRAIFSIRTIRSNHYGTVLLENARSGIRYDPCYMKPANKSAEELVELLDSITTKHLHAIRWTGVNALIIDNWRSMHGRGSVDEEDLGRRLTRIYVKGD